jgi:hypothetical protein
MVNPGALAGWVALDAGGSDDHQSMIPAAVTPVRQQFGHRTLHGLAAQRGQDPVQTPKSEARSASFSEDYVAAPRHINP